MSAVIALPLIHELFEHNYWARDRQLEVCAGLTQEQFLRPMGGSFASLRDTLAHLLFVEWVWLERWSGRSPRTAPPMDGLETLDALAARWREVESAMRAFLETLNDEALTRPVSYVNLQGESWSYPLGRMLLHVLNHQSYHRGQVATLLRQLGVRPPHVDFLVWDDARK
jgi:uncharacterized damage-inducible protein DinB